jgi:adenine-specific DNA methylase
MTTAAKAAERLAETGTLGKPRVLIEDWLPAAAIGVECMRERGSASALAPHTYLHVWWARRPLTAARAAVLGSLLPADFPRDVFERLLGFWGSSQQIVNAQRYLDWARAAGKKITNPHGSRAFRRALREGDVDAAHAAAHELWSGEPSVIDPMAGGGSIPLEAARLGFHALANEYNPVACSVLEATVDYPFRFDASLADAAREYGRELRKRFNARMEKFFPAKDRIPRHTFLYARTVPCPDTGHETPLVPDWLLLKPKSGLHLAAEPVADKRGGTWTVRIREIGDGRGQLRQAPVPTYRKGKGVSLFSGNLIPADYIKAKAQAGEMGSRLYVVAVKTPQGLTFEPPERHDLEAIEAAAKELSRHRARWERENVIPTERIPVGDKTGEPLARGITTWAEIFSPRQLLGMGVLVEELRALRPSIVVKEGEERAGAIEHLLAFAIDKFANWNSTLSSWNVLARTLRSVFDTHDFGVKSTFAEMAPCNAGGGLEWTIKNVLDSWTALAQLPRANSSAPVVATLGSATALPGIAAASLAAVVVDPPYDDNVQYSELADFFYVWLKRTQGHRHPDWFATYLCEHDEEAVVNLSRFRRPGESAADARKAARDHYRELMTGTFRECHRVLKHDGVLTVMFTHKKQEAWEALFTSLIHSGFTITATWPIKTEGQHVLNQARKNAAQSTVLLVARKRDPSSGTGYFDRAMQAEIRRRAESAADRLQKEGLNAVDQLVGSFGPALEVYSRYAEVRTDTGDEVKVDRAIDIASDAVSNWRIQQLAARGLAGVEPEGRFGLLCWDVLGAAEFRFNEAKLLGHAVGMDVAQLVAAGLVIRKSDKINILSAKDRRRNRAIDDAADAGKGGKVHPNDSAFKTAIDGCHALALRYLEAGGGAAGTGAARSLARQQSWDKDSAVARLMEALVRAAPPAVRVDRGRQSAAAKFPEFRAWHALLYPLFGFPAADWTETLPDQIQFELVAPNEPDDDGDSASEDEQEEEDGEDQEDAE